MRAIAKLLVKGRDHAKTEMQIAKEDKKKLSQEKKNLKTALFPRRVDICRVCSNSVPNAKL